MLKKILLGLLLSLIAFTARAQDIHVSYQPYQANLIQGGVLNQYGTPGRTFILNVQPNYTATVYYSNTGTNTDTVAFNAFYTANPNVANYTSNTGQWIPLISQTLVTSPSSSVSFTSPATNAVQIAINFTATTINTDTFSIYVVFNPQSGYGLGGGASGAAITGNAFPVNTTEVLWVQSTGIPTSATLVNTWIIQSISGVQTTVTWTGTYPALPGGGEGTGILVPVNGLLISASTEVTTSGIPNGQAFTQHYILNAMPTGGSTSPAVNALTSGQIQTLLDGAYTNSFYNLTWPWSGAQSSNSGLGSPQTQGLGNPGVGTPLTITPSLMTNGGSRNRVIALSCDIVTSAVAGNRVAVLNYQNPITLMTVAVSPVSQPASTTYRYLFEVGIGANSNLATGSTPSEVFQIPLPTYIDMTPLAAGNYALQFNAFGLLAGDQIQACVIMTNSWQEND
jgi:hypothetical protein